MISVKNTIDKYNLIKKGDVIGCAVSGGSDSMALLVFLLSLRETYDFTLVCINVEHGIRGEDSVKDSEFVKDFCRKNNIRLEFTAVDCPSYAALNKLGIEQAARELRYFYFYGLIEGKKCNKVFIAHNKNDNAETILLNILRGSGNRGLSGMDIDNGRGIIRPMLYTEKTEILDYINANNIVYREDLTNDDNSFSRNFIRNKVFPLLNDKFEGVIPNICRLSDIVREENTFLDKLCQSYIKKTTEGCYISLPCEDVLLKRAVFICCKLLGVGKDIFNVNVNDVASLVKKRNGSKVCLTNRLEVYKEYNSLFFQKRYPKESAPEITFFLGKYDIDQYDITVEQSSIADFRKATRCKGVYYADFDKIGKDAIFRYRKESDSFKRFKGGRKSLSDYFTDIKVPKRIRENILLICDNNNVLAALPYDISDDIRIDENSINIIKITVQEKKL